MGGKERGKLLATVGIEMVGVSWAARSTDGCEYFQVLEYLWLRGLLQAQAEA